MERINGALVRCEERFPQDGARTVLVAVVERDAAQWRDKLTSLHSELFSPEKIDRLQPAQLEVIDRATDEVIQRLIAAGVLSQNTCASRALFPHGGDANCAPLSPEEKSKAKAHRERAARKLKMAQVLGDSGFEDETRPALLEAIYALGCALAVEQRIPEPPELSHALQPPLSHCWTEALPILKTFVEGTETDWKLVTRALASL